MFRTFAKFLPVILLVSCAGRTVSSPPVDSFKEPALPPADFSGRASGSVNPEVLDQLAEMERSGSFVPGLGLAESQLHEQAGDYAGAVLAVYKELAWAHSLGIEGVTRDAVKEGLGKLLAPDMAGLFSSIEARKDTETAVKAILAFLDGRWKEAQTRLEELYGVSTEADSYSRWMLLVCALETSRLNGENSGTAEAVSREIRSSYGAIRARYASFPEYWYRGARVFPAALAGEYAERCINLAPAGPYAAEGRIILARSLGLQSEDAPALRTRLEIEAAISTAVNQGNPELLADLLPLTGLPDNPSTLYAAGAMRALAAEASFQDWFAREAVKAKGRLAERLLFISRG
jgi:hypothetical protein